MPGGPGNQMDKSRRVCRHDVVEKQYPNNRIKSDLEKLSCAAAFVRRLSGTFGREDMTRKTLIHIPAFVILGGSGILLVLSSCVWAADDSFSAYLEACRFLHEGESRGQAARRFAAVASGRPTDRYAEPAASLAAFLKQMASEDDALPEPKDPCK